MLINTQPLYNYIIDKFTVCITEDRPCLKQMKTLCKDSGLWSS